MIRRFLYTICSGIACFCLLIAGPLLVFAGAANDFTIDLFVGNDLNPPTTPVLQSAIPIAATQIDIIWSASTDDVFLSGYRVYRDGVPIATTTLTSFSDGGLIASTTYFYTVDAFDSFNNISTTSNALSTTTLGLPVIPPATTTATTTPGAGSGTRLPGLQSFLLIPSQTGASLVWQTVSPTKYIFKWGRTSSYDSGAISGNLFTIEHTTFIDSLEPGTKYYYELTAIDSSGRARIVKSDSFFTLPAVSSVLPVNVEGFTAVVRDSDVELSWRTGTLPLGAVVRIVRSHLYYPNSITDGSLVYEGTGQGALDKRALAVRSPQFYTAFIITSDGLVSSGAIAVAGLALPTLPSLPGTVEENPVVETGDESVLRAANVLITQGRTQFTLDAARTLQADSEYLLFIPVTAVKPGLKSIIVSVQNPTNQREVSRFLLKINQAGDAYEAILPGPRVTGASRLRVEVFDYSAQSVRQITTTVMFVQTENQPVTFPDGFVPSKAWAIVLLATLTFLLGALLWWLFLLLRRREDNH